MLGCARHCYNQNRIIDLIDNRGNMQQYVFMKDRFKNGSRLFPSAFAFLLMFSLQTQGRVYVVTDTNDTTRITSLRGAIIDANRHGGNNTIILGQSRRRLTYRLTLSGADEDAARTGDLDITRGNLTISGPSSKATIDATDLGDRVFQVFSNAHLTLSHLVITGGTAPFNEETGSEPGGAIFNSGTLTIQNCSIVGNSSGDAGFNNNWYIDSPGGDGGGIYNEGFARLDNCIINDNSAGAGSGPYNFDFGSGENGENGGNGGGIFNLGTMVLNNCTISTNLSGQGGTGDYGYFALPGGAGGEGGGGAGIFNAGKMELNFCTVSGNSGGDGGGGGYADNRAGGNAGAGGGGAGIFNLGTLSINTCTISGNDCGFGGDGGEVYYIGSGGVGGDGGIGGGIYNAGSLSLLSCTITLNEAGAGGNGGSDYESALSMSAASGGQGGSGGGILNDGRNTNVVLRNTLIALNAVRAEGLGGTNISYYGFGSPQQETIGNAGSVGFGPDLAGDFTSQGYNLIGMADGSTGFTNGLKADQVGSIASPIDPLIGPLQMNGGPTPTHALLPGSPAIDQGKSFGVHTDQRGYRRPYNYTAIPNAPGGDGSDIGAFELGAH
jgi:hypothetical protein